MAATHTVTMRPQRSAAWPSPPRVIALRSILHLQNFYHPLGNRASLAAQLVKNPPAMWETWVRSLGWEDPRRSERLPTPVFWLGEFHGLYCPQGRKSRTHLSNFHVTLGSKNFVAVAVLFYVTKEKY